MEQQTLFMQKDAFNGVKRRRRRRVKIVHCWHCQATVFKEKYCASCGGKLK